MQIRKLNSLRGIAAMIVVIGHYSNVTTLLGGVLGHGAGQFGVMLFFILSGFLMSHLYLNKQFDEKNVKHFAIARIARVMPLFVLVVVSSFLLHKAGTKGVLYDILTAKSLLSHLLLLSGVSVLWTIPPEVQFYCLFVLLWWLYSHKKGYLFVLMAAVFCCLVFFRFPDPRWKIWGLNGHGKLIRTLPYFLVGIVFGEIHGKWRPPDYLRKNSFILALLLVPLMFPKVFTFLMGYTHTTWTDAGIFFVVSAVFFALVALVPDNNVVLANPIGDFLGTVSYSLYLLHLPVLSLIGGPAKKSPAAILVVFVALALGTAYASYRLIEAPSRRWLRSIAFGRDGLAPAGTDPEVSSTEIRGGSRRPRAAP